MMAYFKNSIATKDHFTDRMRIMTIISMCLDSDDSVLKQAIALVKESQAEGATYFEASCEQFLIETWAKANKARKERQA